MPETLIAPALALWLRHQQAVGRLRLPASQAVYRAMWGALADWCAAQQPPLRRLLALDTTNLSAYIGSRNAAARDGLSLTPRYQARLLRLVARVQRHACALAAARAQPDLARMALAEASARRPGPRSVAAGLLAMPALAGRVEPPAPPPHLPAAQARQLQQWLQTVPAPPDRWQDLRDRCAAALQLGAGLGPGELRALRLGDVLLLPDDAAGDNGQPLACPDVPPVAPMAGAGGLDPARASRPMRPSSPSQPPALPGCPWALQVPANGSAPAHVAPLAPWAARLLAQWLQLRQALALPGPVLLPSTRSGKPWGKVAQYNAGQAALQAAGLDSRRAGGTFRLRHSFALRQLQLGHSAERVAGWLGVADPAVMARYQRALGPAPTPPSPPPPPPSSRPAP